MDKVVGQIESGLTEVSCTFFTYSQKTLGSNMGASKLFLTPGVIPPQYAQRMKPCFGC